MLYTVVVAPVGIGARSLSTVAKKRKSFGEKVKDSILERLAEGESLRAICQGEDMPAASTVCLWVKDDDAFAERYARAREVGFTLLAEELLEIADDGKNDTYTDDNGNIRTDHDVIARSRLRVDTRKWMLAKMLPKVYGEKVVNEHTGSDGGKIEVAVTHRIIHPNAD